MRDFVQNFIRRVEKVKVSYGYKRKKKLLEQELRRGVHQILNDFFYTHEFEYFISFSSYGVRFLCRT